MRKVSAIILINKNKILLHLRDDKPNISHPNYWSIIGGGIEIGETPLEAIERECLEEIGLVPANIKFLNKIFMPLHGLSEEHEIFIFRGEIHEEVDEIILTEGQRLEYFYLEDIKNLKIPLHIKRFILENRNSLF
jgi:8-oxo-dGTP diphosphatase